MNLQEVSAEGFPCSLCHMHIKGPVQACLRDTVCFVPDHNKCSHVNLLVSVHLKVTFMDFPAGPVPKTHVSNAGGLGFDPLVRELSHRPENRPCKPPL